jgi:hypothetical protein
VNYSFITAGQKMDGPVSREFSCNIGGCNAIAITGVELFHHFRKVHEKEKEFSSMCLASPQCSHSEPFYSFNGLKTHMTRHHPRFFRTQLPANAGEVHDSNEIDEQPISCKNWVKDTLFHYSKTFICSFQSRRIRCS